MNKCILLLLFDIDPLSLARPAGSLVPGPPGGQPSNTGSTTYLKRHPHGIYIDQYGPICLVYVLLFSFSWPPTHTGPATGPTFPPGVGPNPGIGLPDPGASPRYTSFTMHENHQRQKRTFSPQTPSSSPLPCP